MTKQICRKLGNVSQRRVCKVLGQSRSTQRYELKQPEKDRPLTDDILELHIMHPRYGYRRIRIKLWERGWLVNFKRVYRLWCQEGLKVRKRQRKKLHTSCSENACDLFLLGLLLRPARHKNVFSCKFPKKKYLEVENS